jgi:hypothetical protein
MVRADGWRQIDSVFLRGPDVADFRLDTCADQSVNPLTSCAIGVSFTPLGRGGKLAELVVVSGDVVRSIALRGTGVTNNPSGPPVAADPAVVDFALLAGAPADIAVRPTGPLVTVTAVTIKQLGSAFHIDLDGCTNRSLGQTDTCLIRVGYTPEGSDPDAASLTVEHDQGGDSVVVPLSGPGIVATPTPETTPTEAPTPTPTVEPTPTEEPTPTPTVAPTAKSVEVLPASVLTDCIGYDPSTLDLEDLGATGWRLNSSTSAMLITDDLEDAQQALALAKLHTQRCFVGRGNARPDRSRYIATFWTGPSGTIVRIPAGAIPNEDCIGYNPDNLSIEDLGTTGWRLNSGSINMVLVDNEDDANKIKEVASHYRRQCFIGRENTRPNRIDYIEDYWK